MFDKMSPVQKAALIMGIKAYVDNEHSKKSGNYGYSKTGTTTAAIVGVMDTVYLELYKEITDFTTSERYTPSTRIHGLMMTVNEHSYLADVEQLATLADLEVDLGVAKHTSEYIKVSTNEH